VTTIFAVIFAGLKSGLVLGRSAILSCMRRRHPMV